MKKYKLITEECGSYRCKREFIVEASTVEEVREKFEDDGLDWDKSTVSFHDEERSDIEILDIEEIEL